MTPGWTVAPTPAGYDAPCFQDAEHGKYIVASKTAGPYRVWHLLRWADTGAFESITNAPVLRHGTGGLASIEVEMVLQWASKTIKAEEHGHALDLFDDMESTSQPVENASSLPLREPFFLKCRTSVVQRAVIMSVVMGGLAGLTGWLFVAITDISPNPHSEAKCAAWGLATGLLIFWPLNYWNRRSGSWTLFAMGGGILLAYLTLELLPNALSPVLQFDHSTETSICLALLVGVSGLTQLRATWPHAIAFLLSISGAIIPAYISFVGGFYLVKIPGLPEVSRFASELAFVGMWLCLLSIPWGIPFWWPPEKDAGAEA